MKCPNCGIHYDDADRECPMCGTRRPWLPGDTSRLARPSGKPAKAHRNRAKPSWVGEYVTKTCAHPKDSSCPHTGRRSRGKKHTGLPVLLLVALLAVLPAGVEAVRDAVQDTVWQETGGWDEAEATPEGWNEETPWVGIWNLTADNWTWLALSGDVQEENDLMPYRVTMDEYQESGEYYVYENIGETYPDEFPEYQYRWYKLTLFPQETAGTPPGADASNLNIWGTELDMFQTYGGTETWIAGDGTCPWLNEEGTAMIYAQFDGGADEVRTLLAEGTDDL